MDWNKGIGLVIWFSISVGVVFLLKGYYLKWRRAKTPLVITLRRYYHLVSEFVTRHKHLTETINNLNYHIEFTHYSSLDNNHVAKLMETILSQLKILEKQYLKMLSFRHDYARVIESQKGLLNTNRYFAILQSTQAEANKSIIAGDNAIHTNYCAHVIESKPKESSSEPPIKT